MFLIDMQLIMMTLGLYIFVVNILQMADKNYLNVQEPTKIKGPQFLHVTVHYVIISTIIEVGYYLLFIQLYRVQVNRTFFFLLL